jgi:hypothetical protein
VLLVALALGAVSCGGDPSIPSQAESTVARFTRVSAFGVTAVVPDDWVVTPTDDAAYAYGVTASPGPQAKLGTVPMAQGLIATRVDATVVGAPSDLYYLAAKGPIFAQVHDQDRCRVTDEQVYADHAPSAITGHRTSPGDFVATATGTCARRDSATRWSYFVAAPGFGPVRERGIPGSGLYLIVVSTPEAPGASRTLARMIGRVRFGNDGMQDFVHAVRAAV